MSRLTAFSSSVLLPLLFAGASAVLPGEAAPATPRPGSPAAATLARIAGFAGDWAGTAEWSGARTGSYALKARYYTTGYGSAVVEDLISEGVPSMTSVYHLDGSDLRMTHYCGTRNQPRLKASKIDVAGGSIDFTFVDATNLESLRFGDGDHFTMTFLFEGGGKSSRERISLQRVRLKA